MSLSLYEIDNQLQSVMNSMEEWAEEHDGDVSEFPLFDEMNDVELERDDKCLNIGAYIKSLRAEEDAIHKEIQTLKKRKKYLVNQSDKLLEDLQKYLPKGYKLKNSKVSLTWRKNSAVNIPKELEPQDLLDIAPMFVKTKYEFDKTAIKEEIKTSEAPIEIKFGNDIFLIDIPKGKKLLLK